MPSLKSEIADLLDRKDYESIAERAGTRKITGILISLSYDKKTDQAWRAIEAMGIVSGKQARSNPDQVRNLVGRLLWMIRDESGGIGWSAPEMLGEIVRNNPDLCADIAPIIASFHEEKMLTAGVLWALGRIGPINAETVQYAGPILSSYLNAGDHTLRAYAAWAMARMRVTGAAEAIRKLVDDEGAVLFYEEGRLKEMTVGQVASLAMNEL